MNKRFHAVLSLALLAGAASAANSTLLPGSIDFSEPKLWGQEVRYGLNDDGSYSGDTHWYTDDSAERGAGQILQRTGQPTGYMSFNTASGIHRTIPATRRNGPRAEEGEPFGAAAVYFDAEMEFPPYQDFVFPVTNAADRIICWVSQPDESSPTRFMITAGEVQPGGRIVRRDYETKITGVVPTISHHLVVKAFTDENGVHGFNVYLDGTLVSALDDSGSFFPSMGPATDNVYSFGVYGAGSLSFAKFTRVDPIVNPDYDLADLSSLRQGTVITVSGFPEGVGALTNFPLLVRISEESIADFRYRYVNSSGTNLRFSDANGRVLPYDIDIWDTEGESLVWVKVPYLTAGTRIYMQWDQVPNSALPANDAKSVWSEYIAVWHMNEPNYAKDCSGNGFNARLDSSGETAALQRILAGDDDLVRLGAYGRLVDSGLFCEDFEERFPVNGEFTFTGWYRFDGLASQGQSIAGKKLGASTSTQDGWCLVNAAPANGKATFYGNGSAAQSAQVGYDTRQQWGMFGMAYSNFGTMEVYGNGEFAAGGTAVISPTTNLFRLAVAGCSLDEIRIAKVRRSADWIRVEYEQATNRFFTVNNGANSATNYNFWVEEPMVSPSAWTPDEYQPGYFREGRSRYGVVLAEYFNAATGEKLSERPTVTPGSYRAVFSADDGRGNPLVREVYYVIFERSGFSQLSPDRVMLFNSYAAEGSRVDYQGYYDVDGDNRSVWTHSGSRWDRRAEFKYVQNGDMHRYYEPGSGGPDDGELLWRFEHARIGNLFASPTEMYESMNLLPWSGESYRVLDSGKKCDSQEFAGVLLLQNLSLRSVNEEHGETPAAAYSPHYTNGVGSVYFDAVNAWPGYENVLKVQKRKGDFEPWQDVTADVYAVVDGHYEAALSTNGVTRIVMNFSEFEGATNRFYRVIAAVEEPGDVEFRIVRDDDSASGWADGEADDNGLVQIDNIVAGPLSKRVSLQQYGAPAPETQAGFRIDNELFRGQRAPFDIAFPSAADTGRLHGAVRVNYEIGGDTPDPAYVGALTMRYRWRYLNQVVEDWKESLMQVDPADVTRFTTASAIDLPGVGDLEYYFKAIVNMPYFIYRDYSGLNLGSPVAVGEQQRDTVLSAATEGYYLSMPSPALGTNFFVRIRDGASPYESFRLEVREGERGTVKSLPMRVYSDRNWRGFYQTLKPVEGGIQFRLVGLNRQNETLVDYQYNTNYFHSVSYGVDEYDKIPYSELCEEGDAWTTIPCDAVTGHLMFQYDDQMRSLSIIRADYQDFDLWTDAYSPATNAVFLGTSSSLPTSGVASTALQFSEEFEKRFSPTIATNVHWIEHFDVAPSYEGRYPVFTPFKQPARATPNGWLAEYGQYVTEEFGQAQGESISFQMLGGGLGAVYPSDLDARGVGKFTFSARVAQTYDIDSFDHYTGTTNNVYAMSNYAFGVLGAMDADGQSFAGAGALSVVANFRHTKGGYEARLERYSPQGVTLSIYKWNTRGAVLKCVSDKVYIYGKTGVGASGEGGKFAGLFIACSEQDDGSVIVNAGVAQNAITASAGGIYLFNGSRKFYCISYRDAEAPFKSGTFGVGCNNCIGSFARPKVLHANLGRLASQEMGTDCWSGECSMNRSGEISLFPTDSMDFDPSCYDEWNINTDRLDAKNFTADVPRNCYGFKAVAPTQSLQVETSPRKMNLFTCQTNIVVRSFSMNSYAAVLREPENVDIRLRTSDDAEHDVVVDDLEISQWRGENYDDEGNPDRMTFDSLGPHRWQLGAPTNFVYTSAWKVRDGNLGLEPCRCTVDEPSGVRGPLFDGVEGRGIGLGQFSFRYQNADSRCRLLLQVAKDLDVQSLPTATKSLDSSWWTTVKVFDFSDCTDAELASGSCSYYFGEHGVSGVMRVILDPEVISAAHSIDPDCNPERDVNYGAITIVSAIAKDNPAVSESSWWGWNLRTARNQDYEGAFGNGDANMLLLDDAYDEGLAFALNDSVVNDVKPGDEVKAHMPFLQTPVFSKNGIGEVSFKARRYTADYGSPTIAIFGTHSMDPSPADSEYEYITNITVSCDRFETFRIQAPFGSSYTGFRLAITGVNGVTGEKGPWLGQGPQRVLLDQVTVYEAVMARFGFRNTGCFRTGLALNTAKSPFPVKSEQPICGEQWGFQTEIFAASLSNELDLDTPGHEPHVYVHWFEGESPWGYTNWVGNASAKHGELKRADGDGLVYRSSLEFAPDAVAQPSLEPTVVQYSLEVVFYMRGQVNAITNVLSASDWVKPSWYEPVDFNADNRSSGFSAYNIIDTVSPGWAWINEVNIFGEYDSDNYNSDKDFQYLEIAAPATADLSKWSVRFVVPRTGSNSVLTNTVAEFGTDTLKGTKYENIGASSGMVFRVICSPTTWSSGRLKLQDGTVDGVWSFPSPDGTVLTAAGRISESDPVGMQLVRPSGVVEHEIVVLGTNFWMSQSSYVDQYDPNKTVEFFNKYMKGAHFFYVGKDDLTGTAYSLDVATNRGESVSCWTNRMVLTPGRVNTFEDGTPQYLDPNGPPTPLGSSIFIWSTVVTPPYCTTGGAPHLFQTCGEAVDTPELQVLLVQRKSRTGTNILYRTDSWYEIDRITANDVEIPFTTNGVCSYSVTVGKDAIDNINLKATARVSREIDNPELIPGDESRYLPAIVDWFNKHQNAAGVEWPASTDGKVHQAKLWPYYHYCRGEEIGIRPLTLTEMYWLDICPTITNDQYLIAGFTGIPSEIIRTNEFNTAETYTNRIVSVFMAVTNGLGLVENGITNSVYAPYIIRGLDPGSTSWDYAEDSSGWFDGWSNATFKATGILRNGLTRLSNPTNWVPLRTFVFHTNSFHRADCEPPHKPFTTDIELVDPYSPLSYGYQSGWGDWMLKNKKTKSEVPVWYKWSLDERMPPIAVEILRVENLLQ